MDFIQHIRWRPGIGDPTLMGWITVAAYALAAITAVLAARRAGRLSASTRGSRLTWSLVATLMALLCLNKQLDIQSLFTDIGRIISWKQGWYGDRREIQKWVVYGVLATSAFGTVTLAWYCRAFWKKHFLLATGLAFLLTFIVVRAISFHHFETFLNSSVRGVKMNWFLELTGIALVWLAAATDYYNPRKPSAPKWKPAD